MDGEPNGGSDQPTHRLPNGGETMRRKAFTLVELLIVVIILGILAAVVVPQFSDASDDARLSSLMTNLQTIRGQIELYKIQHGSYPATATFANDMTTAAGGYGPYLQTIPNNPYTNTNTIGVGAAGSSAWKYVEATGTFTANDDAAHAAL
jgi:general secretion pathway protein G